MRTADIYQRVTQQIIDAIEAGASAASYRMPWHNWGQSASCPTNASTGRNYRGINVVLLWAAAEAQGYSFGRWATYRQWTATGAQVRKGAKATPIIFWKTSTGAPTCVDDDEDTGTRPGRLIARTYFVFNGDQVEGAEPLPLCNLTETETVTAAAHFIGRTGAQIRHGGDRAYYAPSIDQIWLPQNAQFRDLESYYAVLAHELVHWTGATHRLDRPLDGRFGDEAYAFEELIAELGAAFLAAHLGLSREPRHDHAVYIASWLKVLKSDPKAILTAASKAQQAADYLLDLTTKAAQTWPHQLTEARTAAKAAAGHD
ncbi:MAG: ArdC family protein [Novosphingobium sp.]